VSIEAVLSKSARADRASISPEQEVLATNWPVPHRPVLL